MKPQASTLTVLLIAACLFAASSLGFAAEAEPLAEPTPAQLAAPPVPPEPPFTPNLRAPGWEQAEKMRQWNLQRLKQMQQQAERARSQAHEHWKRHAPAWATQASPPALPPAPRPYAAPFPNPPLAPPADQY